MEDNSYKEKDVAFYSAALQAWYTTRFERDKHLLSLSTAGIGLLVTLLTTVGAGSGYTVVMYVCALVPYISCMIAVLLIFQRNSDHLQNVVQGKDESDPILRILDKFASSAFIVGVVFTMLVGCFSAMDQHNSKESSMSKDKMIMVEQGSSSEKKSVNGAGTMRPAPSTPSSSTDSNSSADKKN